MFFHMAEYCDTLQSKEKRSREYKACLNERAILHLLDHEFMAFLQLVGRVTCGINRVRFMQAICVFPTLNKT